MNDSEKILNEIQKNGGLKMLSGCSIDQKVRKLSFLLDSDYRVSNFFRDKTWKKRVSRRLKKLFEVTNFRGYEV
jgi:hypothetical protein